MYQRVVSLLLLPCVLLTQSAALGHSHGGSQPAGHNLRPHFHTNSSSAPRSDDHGHHHHGPDGHHHYHDDGDDVPEPDTQPTPAPEPLSEQEHDSDAVYINRVDVVINDRPAVDDELAASLQWAAAGLHLPSAFWADPSHEAVNWTHAPPPSGYACPLYLWHLALLI